jgi:hypothetical protein
MGGVRFRSVLLALRWVWAPRAWRGAGPVRVIVVLLVQVGIVAGVAGRRASEALLPVLWCLAMPLLAALTAAVERSARRQLEFTALLPLPRTTSQWLVLVPSCFVAIALAVSLAAAGHLTIADTVSFFGLGWWAVAVGHALASRRLRSRIFLMPLACWLAVVAYGIVDELAGDWVASTVAVVLGVLALAVVSAGPLERASPTGRRRSSYEPRSAPVIHALPRSRRAGTLSTSFRIWLMTTPRWRRYLLVGLVTASLMKSLGSAPMMPSTSIVLVLVLSEGLMRALSPATLAFLRARPFTRRSLALGTWLPCIALVVLSPLCMFLTIQEAWFIGPHPLGLAGGGRNKLPYLRDVLGATFLPALLPAEGLPAEVWPALRPLLVRNALRLVLLSLALFFSWAGQGMASARRTDGRALWPGWLSSLLVSAMVVPCLDVARSWRIPWAPPPVWLAGAMALVTALFALTQDLPRQRRFPTRDRAPDQAAPRS